MSRDAGLVTYKERLYQVAVKLTLSCCREERTVPEKTSSNVNLLEKAKLTARFTCALVRQEPRETLFFFAKLDE